MEHHIFIFLPACWNYEWIGRMNDTEEYLIFRFNLQANYSYLTTILKLFGKYPVQYVGNIRYTGEPFGKRYRIFNVISIANSNTLLPYSAQALDLFPLEMTFSAVFLGNRGYFRNLFVFLRQNMRITFLSNRAFILLMTSTSENISSSHSLQQDREL